MEVSTSKILILIFLKGDDGVVECIKDDKPDKPVNTYLSSTKGHSVVRSSDVSKF